MTTTRTPNRLAGAVIGDQGDTRTLTLTGVESLAGATTVHAHAWTADVDAITLTGSVVGDGSTSQVSIPLADLLTDDAAVAGTWLFEVVIDKGMSSELTWPSRRAARLSLREQGG